MPESGVDQARSGVTDLRSVAEQPAPADWRGFMDRQWARPSGDVAEAFLPPPTGQAPHPYGQAAGLFSESPAESFQRFGDGPLRMRMIGVAHRRSQPRAGNGSAGLHACRARRAARRWSAASDSGNVVANCQRVLRSPDGDRHRSAMTGGRYGCACEAPSTGLFLPVQAGILLDNYQPTAYFRLSLFGKSEQT